MASQTRLRLVAPVIAILVTLLPVVGPSESSQQSALAASAERNAPLAGARDDPRFPVSVDLVIEDQAQWDAHVAAAKSAPGTFEGMVIGVVIPPDTVVGQGGAAASAADEALAKETAVHEPTSDPVPLCARDLGAPPPSGGFGVYLACAGDEPSAYFVARTAPADLDPTRAGLEAAVMDTMNSLAERNSPVETQAGYYYVLGGTSGVVRSASFENGTLTLDFDEKLRRLGVDEIGTGSTLLQQVARTALSFETVQQVRPTLNGDCAEFWRSVGGNGCHTLSRSDVQE